MPRYLDHHPTDPNLPPELVAEIIRRLRSGHPDEFGEVGLDVFVGAERTWCHTEAPDPDAVRSSHRALGVELAPDAVAEVQVLP
ncbi:MAG TPA: hypothetical protein VHM23_02900 [Actinomycetota bacterium]|jgi:hypothetical protein|nr:hypothetical protein [Actinomycetota bacterium]